jgi:CheY-like chemotaxis protein
VTAAAVTPVILLVEDDPDHTELVRRAIEELGRDVRLVALADGEIALDYLFRRGEWSDPERSPKPDLVFLDLRLPRLDGFSVLREIKNAAALRHVPVVILSSTPTPSTPTATS